MAASALRRVNLFIRVLMLTLHRFGSNEPSVDMLRKADAWVDDVLPGLLTRLRRGFGAVHLMVEYPSFRMAIC